MSARYRCSRCAVAINVDDREGQVSLTYVRRIDEPDWRVTDDGELLCGDCAAREKAERDAMRTCPRWCTHCLGYDVESRMMHHRWEFRDGEGGQLVVLDLVEHDTDGGERPASKPGLGIFDYRTMGQAECRDLAAGLTAAADLTAEHGIDIVEVF